MLRQHQISEVRKVLDQARVGYSLIRDELLDHLCCQIEALMTEGLNFEDALLEAVYSFGPEGLKQVESESPFKKPGTVFFRRVSLAASLAILLCLATIPLNDALQQAVIPSQTWQASATIDDVQNTEIVNVQPIEESLPISNGPAEPVAKERVYDSLQPLKAMKQQIRFSVDTVTSQVAYDDSVSSSFFMN